MYKNKTLKDFCGYPLDIVLIKTNKSKHIKKTFDVKSTNFIGMCSIGYIEGEEKIVILFNTKYEIDSSIVAHECFHAQSILFEYIGEEGKCEEPRAYLLENIHKEVIKFLKLEK